jgi:hypothetical protein
MQRSSLRPKARESSNEKRRPQAAFLIRGGTAQGII